jgi:hypothetical protein
VVFRQKGATSFEPLSSECAARLTLAIHYAPNGMPTGVRDFIRLLTSSPISLTSFADRAQRCKQEPMEERDGGYFP